MTTPRGLRNNNPLNIEKTKGGNPWQGEIVPSGDSRFAQFRTIAYGYRAAFKLLNNYQRNYGLDTIRKMIGRWAPSNENHTDTYVRTVAERSGVPADQSNHHDKPGCDGAHCGGDVVCGERR